MVRQIKVPADQLPSGKRADELVRLLKNAQADARMLKARINEAAKKEQSTLIRSTHLRRPKRTG
jgi:hypothetical protein